MTRIKITMKTGDQVHDDKLRILGVKFDRIFEINKTKTKEIKGLDLEKVYTIFSYWMDQLTDARFHASDVTINNNSLVLWLFPDSEFQSWLMIEVDKVHLKTPHTHYAKVSVYKNLVRNRVEASHNLESINLASLLEELK